MGDPLISVDTIVGAYPDFANLTSGEQTRRIAAATASVEAFVGRPLGLTTATETRRPDGSRLLYLKITPVVSIASIVYGKSGSTTAITDYTILDADAGVVEIYQSLGGGYRYPDRTYGGDPRAGTITITYTGGWATADVPADVQDALIHAVIARGATVSLSGAGIYASEQIGSYSYRLMDTAAESSVSSSMGLPATATGALRKYKRVRII